jgi:hypothetical protein
MLLMEYFQPNLWDQKEEKWLPFVEARIIAHGLNFEYKEEWEEFASHHSLPDRVPDNPAIIYKHTGWKSWVDWLMDPSKRKNYSNFSHAREFARSLGIRADNEWMQFLSDNPEFPQQYNLTLPLYPQFQYKAAGWINWSDFLGLTIDYKDFITTRKFIWKLNLESKEAWIKYCKTKKPENIYSYPEIAYSDKGWIGWDDWLGIQISSIDDKTITDVPEGALICKCLGLLTNCLDCDGKGYYFLA